MSVVLSLLKRRLISQRRRPVRVKAGLLRGMRLSVDRRNDLQREYGLAERELRRWFGRLSQGIRSAADVGAAQGDYSLFFLSRTGATRIVAFEPQPQALQMLRENLRLNGFAGEKRVQIVEKFVGERAGGDECLLEDSLLGAQGPCLIKLDVEGRERDVLAASPRLLARPDVRWIIEAHSTELAQQCQRLLKKAGYLVRTIRPAWWRTILPESRGEWVITWLAAWRQPPAAATSRSAPEAAPSSR